MSLLARAMGIRHLVAITAVVVAVGCKSPWQKTSLQEHPIQTNAELIQSPADRPSASLVTPASYLEMDSDSTETSPAQSATAEARENVPKALPAEGLADLEALAVTTNPTLRRMQQEAAAEWAQIGYAGALPDPSISSMLYTPPMNFEPDRQLAEIQVMQMIPWLSRLKAETQRAHIEALAAQTMYQAERIRIIGDVRATWFKLYILGKQLATAEGEKAQLKSLITTANSRIVTGDAQPGDVLMATLEFSSLQEQLLSYQREFVATSAELNRLVGRESRAAIRHPTTIDVQLPNWNHDRLRTIAMESQPELNAARLRTAATRWGIEVARLNRRPDLTFGIGNVFMDAPGSTLPGAGRDSITLGVSATLPLSRCKYDSLRTEAKHLHGAAHASEDEVVLKLDAMLAVLWEQATTGQATVELYETSILPQARQAFEADQKSLANDTVTFDRVIRDYRALLNLELAYHRALGELAITLARIRQAIGVDLDLNILSL